MPISLLLLTINVTQTRRRSLTPSVSFALSSGQYLPLSASVACVEDVPPSKTVRRRRMQASPTICQREVGKLQAKTAKIVPVDGIKIKVDSADNAIASGSINNANTAENSIASNHNKAQL